MITKEQMAALWSAAEKIDLNRHEKWRDDKVRSFVKDRKNNKSLQSLFVKLKHNLARSGKVDVSMEDYIDHIEKTECDSCGTDVHGYDKHFDHCHDTGKYRGTLCTGCNKAEGFLKTPENAEKLACYMRDRCV